MRQMAIVGFLQAQNCTQVASSLRHPEARLDFLTADYFQHVARVLEAGKFHLGFFDDRLAMPEYGPDCPVAVVYRASWPDERILRGTLATIADVVVAAALERTALILVGPALGEGDFAESALYDRDYRRRFRKPPGPLR